MGIEILKILAFSGDCGDSVKVSYSFKAGDSTTGSLKISTPVPDQPFTCQFSEIVDGQPEPIDTQYLHKKEIGRFKSYQLFHSYRIGCSILSGKRKVYLVISLEN